MLSFRFRTAAVLLAAGAALAATALCTAPAAQARALPVDYDFALGALAGFAHPQTPPPGADNGCRPSAAHPEPVILVNGTFANQDDNWQAASPLLANHGYCVFTFNYGGPSASSIVQSTGDIATSAGQLGTFVSTVLAQTGAAKVDLVGHSQGGMMPRYYLKFDGGAAHVDKLVALAPSNHGTTLDGLTALVTALGQVLGSGLVNGAINALCTACVQQETGSPFLANLNAGGETVAGVSYTVIESRYDEVVTPYTSAFLSGSGSGVRNILLQNQCALDLSDHLEIAADPVALADVLNALDPAHPVRVPCLTVLPITGPVGPVPSF
ncbi:MAG TPA: alpha/beta fold hydrolase [Streptosporangiaceae bacterium]|nr:alpha/beta fold hydrolase [Streptosporangiaceae bacterium]